MYVIIIILANGKLMLAETELFAQMFLKTTHTKFARHIWNIVEMVLETDIQWKHIVLGFYREDKPKIHSVNFVTLKKIKV